MARPVVGFLDAKQEVDNLGLERRVQLRQFLGERALLGCDLVVFRCPFPLARRPT